MDPSFTNINDPAGVKALLEQLRATDSWKTISAPVAATATTTTDEAPAPPPPDTAQPSSSDRISSLLSQLQNPVPVPHVAPRPPPAPAPVAARSALTMDVRHLSFQQALPHLSRLAEDDRVREALVRIRDEQRALERSLSEQRAALVRAQQSKAENERKMATITGGNGLTQWHAQWFNNKFEKELLKFDREQVLKAWDGLVARQQAELEKLGVPTMFVTDAPADREKQQRVVQVLEGIFGVTDE